jgi:PHD/YefM family antitoxin component YafN of YafNO toxin-antitoxin module
MLKYTLKEYRKDFDKKMSEYLSAFEDNTPTSFIEQQKALFTTYNNALLLIADELKKYGELEAYNIYLSNTVFDDLKKISSVTYDDIRIEEKFKPMFKGFQTFEEYLENRDTSSEDHCTRIDYIKLRNHLTSVGSILEFLKNQSLKYQIETPMEGENDSKEDVESPKIQKKEISDSDMLIIAQHLSPYATCLSVRDYEVLTQSLLIYFNTGNFPKLEKKINFRHLNKKHIGWALKEIYKRFRTTNLPIELFRFAQQHINLFENEVIDEDNFRKSSFYKSFTTKPQSYKYPNTP